MDTIATLRETPFAEEIATLETLLAQSQISFLLGAGCSVCAGLPMITGLTETVLGADQMSPKSKKLLSLIKEQFQGNGCSTIEDYLSELVDLLAIADRRAIRLANNCSVNLNNEFYTTDDIRIALSEIKSEIVQCIDSKSLEIATHRNFVKAVHRPVRPGKSEFNKVDYFVLNYDTLLEDALALEQIPYTDGFQGGATGWWDPTVYDNHNAMGRVFKLHGSIDWCKLEGIDIPARKRPGAALSLIKPVENVIIYPASTKYKETQLNPHAQLMHFMREKLRSANDSLLLIIGYNFADSHINTELVRALNENEQLTCLVFTSNIEPSNILPEKELNRTIAKQVRIYSKNGFFHGDTALKSEVELPWWKFEILTRILQGER